MLAFGIFAVTLVFVIWQPRGLGIGWSAGGGAILALACGVIHWGDIPVVWHIVWNATFTFVALIIISLVLDAAGFFKWAALHVARWGQGRGRRLFPLILLLGFVMAAFFANDGAILLLTPIMLAILAELEFKSAAALAFVIATGFVVDSTSLPLVISNLVNIVSANYYDIGFNRYALVMVPVDFCALAATVGMLWWYFRKDIPGHYKVEALAEPRSAIIDTQIFRAAFPVMGVLLAAYLVTARFDIPVSFVTILGALVLLGIAGRWAAGGQGAVINIIQVVKNAPWQIVVFSLGMYLVVYGLRNAGLTSYLATWLDALGRHGIWAAAIGTGFLSAALSSVMNNMPSVLIGVLAIQQTQHVAPLTQQAMVYANVIGCDLGPKFTPIGSLATLLWLHVLAGKGQNIGWGQYMKIGIVITPPVLLAALVALVLWLPVVGH
jgi:arsenical pump membrane protein